MRNIHVRARARNYNHDPAHYQITRRTSRAAQKLSARFGLTESTAALIASLAGLGEVSR